MSGATQVLAASTWSDAAVKLGNSFGAVAVFLAIVLGVFFAAGRATGRFYRPLSIAIFVGPAVVLLLIGLVIPAIRTFYLSLLSDDSSRFLGLKNFQWAFTTSGIQQVLINTLLWIIIAPVVTTLLGLSLALLVDKASRQVRKVMAEMRIGAAVIDTSHLNMHQLKTIIQERYGGTGKLAVTLVSFGFKLGLPLDAALRERNIAARCGLYVVDITTGDIAHSITIEGIVSELYEVTVIPGARQPSMIGLNSEEQKRTITVE